MDEARRGDEDEYEYEEEDERAGEGSGVQSMVVVAGSGSGSGSGSGLGLGNRAGKVPNLSSMPAGTSALTLDMARRLLTTAGATLQVVSPMEVSDRTDPPTRRKGAGGSVRKEDRGNLIEIILPGVSDGSWY